jgi:diguanylate cyclase (GGDEF)-like protein
MQAQLPGCAIRDNNLVATSPMFINQATLGITCLIISIIFFMAWKTLGEMPYALNWAVAFAASAFYWLANLVVGWFPSFEAYWLTINALGFVSITLALRGHCQRTNCERLPGNLWPYTGLVFAGVIWTTLVQPHAGLSAAILPSAAAITLLLSASMILKHRESPRPAEWAAAVTMIIFSLVQFPAAVFVYGLGPEQGVVAEMMFSHPTVLVIPAGFVGMAMFVIFMLASDVSVDMKEIAVRDQLTELLNRRGFGEQSALAYATSRRQHAPVSVIMTDIDHFKSVNDEFGHAAGDEALAHFAGLLREYRRVDDIAARIGGEEFALVLPGTGIEEAISVADDLCRRLAASPLIVDGRDVVMTASFGVAAISEKDTSLTDVIVRADRALYRSKRAGRNRVDLESSQLMRAVDGSLEAVTQT